jgi:hypothetical protein
MNASEIQSLPHEQQLRFYESLAHNLTVCIRAHAFSGSDAGERLENIKWINEILHRATAKVGVLRRRTHTWSESDFFSMMDDYIRKHPAIGGDIKCALESSFRSSKG